MTNCLGLQAGISRLASLQHQGHAQARCASSPSHQDDRFLIHQHRLIDIPELDKAVAEIAQNRPVFRPPLRNRDQKLPGPVVLPHFYVSYAQGPPDVRIFAGQRQQTAIDPMTCS